MAMRRNRLVPLPFTQICALSQRDQGERRLVVERRIEAAERPLLLEQSRLLQISEIVAAVSDLAFREKPALPLIEHNDESHKRNDGCNRPADPIALHRAVKTSQRHSARQSSIMKARHAAFGERGSIGVTVFSARMSSRIFAAISTFASPFDVPMICNPTGSPSTVKPHGNDSAGHPAVVAA